MVEQVSLDLQAEFPGAKGFSARNLWWMKQWYSFYTNAINGQLLAEVELHADISEPKLNQLGSEIKEWKLNRDGSEIAFPPIFAYVPWRHHVLIMQKCKSVEEALFYIRKTIPSAF